MGVSRVEELYLSSACKLKVMCYIYKLKVMCYIYKLKVMCYMYKLKVMCYMYKEGHVLHV